MWQHKQEERELKRIEGDVIKNQRAVRRTLRDYENGTFITIVCFSDYLVQVLIFLCHYGNGCTFFEMSVYLNEFLLQQLAKNGWKKTRN